MSGENGSLPFSMDAEKAVLCSLIRSPGEVAGKCLYRITPAAFYVPAHAIIYEVLLEWPHPERAIDFVWLKQALEDRGQLEEVGDKEFLNDIYGFGTPPSNAEYYVKILREKLGRRTCILEARRLEQAAWDPGALPEQWDPDGRYLRSLNHRKLNGASFLDFCERAVDGSKTLLGDRYLCRGGGMFVVAPSGHGKSVLVAQASIQWACGIEAFGIKPARPLSSLIVQAEDDEGDTIEMAQIVKHLRLTPRQKELVSKNTHVEFLNDVTGKEFVRACDAFLGQFKADLLWVNPYQSYLGEEIRDPKANTQFLRNWLNPILTRRGCAAIIIHHTPKTNFRDTTNWKPSDWMYSGAGAADLTNWSRAYLVIDPHEQPGLYKFIAAKRGKRIGWGDRIRSFERYFAWSTNEGELLWLEASQDQVSEAKAKGQSTPDDILPLIPLVEAISQERLFVAAKKGLGLGVNKVRDFLKILIDEGKVEARPIKRKGVKSGIGYIRTGGNNVRG